MTITTVGEALAWSITSVSAMTDSFLWGSRVGTSVADRLRRIEGALEALLRERPEFSDIPLERHIDTVGSIRSRLTRRREIVRVLKSVAKAVAEEMRAFQRKSASSATSQRLSSALAKNATAESPFLVRIYRLIERLESVDLPDDVDDDEGEDRKEAASDDCARDLEVSAATLAETLVADSKKNALARRADRSGRSKTPGRTEAAIAELERVVALLNESKAASDVSVICSAVPNRKADREIEIKPRYEHLLQMSRFPHRLMIISAATAVGSTRSGELEFDIEWRVPARRMSRRVIGAKALLKYLAREVGEVAARIEIGE